MSDHDGNTKNVLSDPICQNPTNTSTKNELIKNNIGLQSVLQFGGFRRLWIGQIFSQLADKFYIVLMVYLKVLFLLI